MPSVSWTGASGTTYYIYVTGFGCETGAFTLTTRCGNNNALCTENGLTLEFQTDAAPFETTWEIRNDCRYRGGHQRWSARGALRCADRKRLRA
jgi:hypothetical protein